MKMGRERERNTGKKKVKSKMKEEDKINNY